LRESVCMRVCVRIYARSTVSINMQQAEPMDQRQGHMHQKDTPTPYTIHRTHHTYRDTWARCSGPKAHTHKKRIHDTNKGRITYVEWGSSYTYLVY